MFSLENTKLSSANVKSQKHNYHCTCSALRPEDCKVHQKYRFHISPGWCADHAILVRKELQSVSNLLTVAENSPVFFIQLILCTCSIAGYSIGSVSWLELPPWWAHGLCKIITGFSAFNTRQGPRRAFWFRFLSLVKRLTLLKLSGIQIKRVDGGHGRKTPTLILFFSTYGSHKISVEKLLLDGFRGAAINICWNALHTDVRIIRTDHLRLYYVNGQLRSRWFEEWYERSIRIRVCYVRMPICDIVFCIRTFLSSVFGPFDVCILTFEFYDFVFGLFCFD